MDSSHDEDDQSTGDPRLRDLLSLDSADISNILGEPLVSPRIGEEYQAQIPPLLTEAERLQISRNPLDSGITFDVSHSFLLGLPVPITWIKEVKTTKDEPVEVIDGSTDAVRSNGSVNHVNDTKSRSSLKKHQDSKVDTSNPLNEKNGRFPVPGLPAGSWTDFEVDCFILGLYIFGKNLIQVERFMGCKDMGQILSFYYGRFYRSPSYCRWSDCRKMSSRKCIVGQKLFLGARQHELISRLLPRLSEEYRSTLQEVSKAYGEGRTSMEDYVFPLKNMVGLEALVEAVGIGKGKEDLTTLAIETSRTARISSSRTELLSGREFSSLTCAEIVKFLTGGARLSKARSNDLFWEAVWPRLLAKAWHSEGYKGAKSGLVFLMPGVKKFSRRKLVKGDHYFDSVSDVLSRVGSEPQLIELEDGEAGGGTSKVENGCAAESGSASDDDNASDHERHRYLKPIKPRAGNTSSLMRFTVVDTSSRDCGAKIMELRSIPPFQAKSSLVGKKRSMEINGILSREPAKEPVTDDGPLNGLKSHVVGSASENIGNGKMACDGTKPSDGSVESLEDRNSSLSQSQHSRTIKHQFSRRPKVNRPNSSFPVLKRRKLLDCTNASTMASVGEGRNATSSSPVQERDVASLANSLTEMSLKDSLETGNSEEKSEKCDELSTFQEHDDKSEAPPSIKAELETVEEAKMEAEGESGSQNHPASSEQVVASEQKTVAIGRRQSTRVRPMTTKALEALQNGLLSPKQTRKRRRAWSPEDDEPRLSIRSRRVRNIVPKISNVDEGTTKSIGNRYDEASDSTALSLKQKCRMRISGPTNCSVSKGTEPEGSSHDMAQAPDLKTSPSDQTSVRKTESMNCERSCGQEQVSNSESTNRFTGGATENVAPVDINSVAQPSDQKQRPSIRFIIRNVEAAKAARFSDGEGAKSKGKGKFLVFHKLGHSLDPSPRPHVSNTDSAKCSVAENAKNVESANCITGQGTEAVVANGHERVEKPKQKSTPSDRFHVGKTEAVNRSTREGTERSKAFTSMMQALDNPLFHANQQVARELLGFCKPSKYS